MKVGPALVVVLVRVEVVLVVEVVVILLVVEVEDEVVSCVVEDVVVPGGEGEESSHSPKADWHPTPQYSGPDPHQKNCEQHGPHPAPATPGQMVELPHCPLVVMIPPVGTGTNDEEVLLLVLVVLMLVVLVVLRVLLVVLVLVGRVEVLEVVATGRGHPHTP